MDHSSAPNMTRAAVPVRTSAARGSGRRFTQQVDILRAVASDGLVVDAVLPHVDASLPAALEGVFHFDTEAADAVNEHLQRLAILYRAEALVIGAAADEVARSERQTA